MLLPNLMNRMDARSKENMASELFCSVFGHNYVLTPQLNDYYTCKCCNKEFKMNEEGELVVLSPKQKEINSLLILLSTKKRKSKRTTVRPLDFI